MHAYLSDLDAVVLANVGSRHDFNIECSSLSLIELHGVDSFGDFERLGKTGPAVVAIRL